MRLLYAIAIVSTFLLLVVASTETARADGAVTEILVQKIKIYPSHRGGKPVRKYSRKDIKMPAPFYGKPSRSGLIKVRFTIKDKPVSGWIKKSQIETNEKIKLDVGGCAKVGGVANLTVRGVRGADEGC